jgi:hypothetical protein
MASIVIPTGREGLCIIGTIREMTQC